ncbi:MAG: NtrZ family periplasmic regulatory protein [Caulobacteraceae bacterium]
MTVALAIAALGFAPGAWAQQASVTLVADSGAEHGPFALQGTHRTLEWDARKGRWGLSLDVEQHRDGETGWGDVQPGLYYRITPRLHIGGAVSLSGERADSPIEFQPQQPSPRVRLETTFKF